jgi:hypothetical protein
MGLSGAVLAAPAHAAVRCLGVCVAEIMDDTPRPAGAIGLIGDSVLIGVDPWIDGDLAGAGWGPIHYFGGTGTRAPADNPIGAAQILADWRATGYDPPVWIIGIGADDVGFVGDSQAASEADIEVILNAIGPDRDVVMATIQHPNKFWQTNWNNALRAIAARNPELDVVEWQAEADQHPDWWGGDGVHLSPTGYRQRSLRLTAATLPLRAARQVAAARLAATPVGTPATFVPVDPVRVLDTRTTRTRMAAGATQVVNLAAVLPSGATAASVNLTVDNPSGDGYLTAFPCGTKPPLASNLNYLTRRPRGAAATVALDAHRRLCVLSSAATELVVDASGAYVPSGSGSRFTPVTPKRLLDTRTRAAVGAGTVVKVGPFTRTRAVALNLTATQPSGAGYLTAYPCEQPRPLASNVNFGPGDTVANLAVVPVGRSGTVCVYAFATTHVIVDLLGIYGSSGLRFQAAVPVRLLDTRTGTGGWQRRPAQLQILSLPALNGAAAMSITLTAVSPAANGYATAFPCPSGPPLASNLNYPAWTVAVANAAVVGTPACVVAQARSHLLADLAGWWAR